MLSPSVELVPVVPVIFAHVLIQRSIRSQLRGSHCQRGLNWPVVEKALMLLVVGNNRAGGTPDVTKPFTISHQPKQIVCYLYSVDRHKQSIEPTPIEETAPIIL